MPAYSFKVNTLQKKVSANAPPLPVLDLPTRITCEQLGAVTPSNFGAKTELCIPYLPDSTGYILTLPTLFYYTFFISLGAYRSYGL